jgi:hypothetical protein
MAASTPTRSAAATIAIAGLVAIAAWCVWELFVHNCTPRGPRWTFPIANTTGWTIAIAGEAVGAAIALRRSEHVVSLAFALGMLGLLACLPVSIAFGAPRFDAHAVWLACGGLWLVTIGTATAIARWCVRRRPDLPRARALGGA